MSFQTHQPLANLQKPLNIREAFIHILTHIESIKYGKQIRVQA